MTKTRWIPDVRALATAVGGSLALGALLGLPFGPQALVRTALTLPAVLFGVAIICAPALCIGGNLLGRELAIDSAAAAFATALGATGHALLGFVPVALFLATTGSDHEAAGMPVVALIAIAVLLGLMRLWSALAVERERRARILPLFLGWSVVSLGIGILLMARLLTTRGLS